MSHFHTILRNFLPAATVDSLTDEQAERAYLVRAIIPQMSVENAEKAPLSKLREFVKAQDIAA